MDRILITGATGNIGKAVIHYLFQTKTDYKISAAARTIGTAENIFLKNPNLDIRQFDFEDETTFASAFKGINILFLLRPPHISEVKKLFRPLLQSAKENGVQKIVFLSVQGAEKSKVIPHNKIEGLIKSFGFDYIFVRPSYFMQNLTTTLLPEILKSRTITLPSGKAKFNWIDVENIGEASARLIGSFDKYKNNTFEITGNENKSFPEVTKIITEVTGVEIKFKSLNPIIFYIKKRRAGLPGGYALVMCILHFLPRFQKEPGISNSYKKLTGNEPTTVKEFIDRERGKFFKNKNLITPNKI
jgi:uncharacterized protein YbjT (DUF2867 family)